MEETYGDFVVVNIEDKFSFVHVRIEDSEEFYQELFDFFFTEEKLLHYAENKFNLKFEPSTENYTTLFKHLKIYIDDYIEEELDLESIHEEVLKIINEEYATSAKDSKLKVRLDKIGKIGEFIFTCILNEYFKFDCIIPKILLATSYNMSIYGIDVLFYSKEQNMILYGESKVSKSLSNGVSLVNESLKEYEKRLNQEYDLILSSRIHPLNFVNEIYGEYISTSLTFEEFIEKANIKRIGIPIFIAHGKEYSQVEILNLLKNIKKKSFLGLDTIYYLISLPILNKEKMVAVFTENIQKRKEFYSNARGTKS